MCKDNGVLFHTDATHTFTKIPLDVQVVPVDLITISAHTIHGPSGIGGIYIRKGTPLRKWMDGGFQESNRRAGLENIPGAVDGINRVFLWAPARANGSGGSTNRP